MVTASVGLFKWRSSRPTGASLVAALKISKKSNYNEHESLEFHEYHVHIRQIRRIRVRKEKEDAIQSTEHEFLEFHEYNVHIRKIREIRVRKEKRERRCYTINRTRISRISRI